MNAWSASVPSRLARAMWPLLVVQYRCAGSTASPNDGWPALMKLSLAPPPSRFARPTVPEDPVDVQYTYAWARGEVHARARTPSAAASIVRATRPPARPCDSVGPRRPIAAGRPMALVKAMLRTDSGA